MVSSRYVGAFQEAILLGIVILHAYNIVSRAVLQSTGSIGLPKLHKMFKLIQNSKSKVLL